MAIQLGCQSNKSIPVESRIMANKSDTFKMLYSWSGGVLAASPFTCHIFSSRDQLAEAGVLSEWPSQNIDDHAALSQVDFQTEKFCTLSWPGLNGQEFKILSINRKNQTTHIAISLVIPDNSTPQFGTNSTLVYSFKVKSSEMADSIEFVVNQQPGQFQVIRH